MTEAGPRFANPYADLLAAAPEGVLRCELAVIGCGNLLRTDDGAGPVLIRELWEGGVPSGVRLVDGGTAGMDVAFQMRGAARVILVDAARTDAAPGTVFRIPGPEVEQLPPLSGLHSHSFRWDHALAFAHWLLAGGYPADVTVYLIEGADFTPGGAISQPVRAASLDPSTDTSGFLRLMVKGTAPPLRAGLCHPGVPGAGRHYAGPVHQTEAVLGNGERPHARDGAAGRPNASQPVPRPTGGPTQPSG